MLRNGLEPWHLLVVAIVFVVLFGSKKLPDMARSLGKSARILKSEAAAMKSDGAPVARYGGEQATESRGEPVARPGGEPVARDRGGSSVSAAPRSGGSAPTGDR